MTKRLKEIHEYVNQLSIDIPDSNVRLAAKGHSCCVSSCCVMLALHRGLDPELAAVSGLLHDIYRYKTGISIYHGHNGAEMARVVLKRAKNYFSESEKEIILSAIFHHGEKTDVHGDYDEVLKDADTLSPILYSGGINHDDASLYQFGRGERLAKMAGELNLPIDIPYFEESIKNAKTKPTNKRLLLADAAERLAGASITGSRQNDAYMNLIRYWPEDNAFDELLNGWCAAFVYHCCQEAGILLPIKWPTEDVRFAGVAPWNTWARRMGYFIKDEPGTIPQRGDIVLYRNSILPENKLEEHRHIPIDHIGVFLSSGGGYFTVAEGNVNNQNVSGILSRPLHHNVEGYIRIDDSFVYGNWKFDYKTKTEKIL